MKVFLLSFCCLVIACMLWITTLASLDRSVLEGGRGLWPDPWFIATLADAYFAFLTFFLWVAYKEVRWLSRVGWLIAILLLGNFAMSAYLIVQLFRTRPFSAESLLLRRPIDSSSV
ncbi:DUF1475 domain-containing protein [bacterium]|nr:DUF1475 domain-containing protein [bacterium]MDC0278659.1 DUF1475 domain-containing protein [bacterium]